jgi:hypothetical protein
MQDTDRSPSDGSLADKINPSPGKMFLPVVVPRIEKPDDPLGFRINSREIRSLVKITVNARQGEIPQIVCAIMAFGNNVLDVEISQRGVLLLQVTVLATVLGSFTNFPSDFDGNAHSPAN